MDNEPDLHNDKELKKKARYFGITACIVIIFYFCIKRSAGLAAGFETAWKVFQPIFIGLVMAFLMNPIMVFFEKKLSRPMNKICKTEESAKKANRIISAIIALIILVGAVVLFFATAVPQLIDTIVYLVNNIEEQIQGILDWANEITGGRYEESIMNAKNSKIDELIDKAVDFVQKYVDYDQDELITMITTYVISIGTLLVNLLIGMFVSVYVLISKETFKGQIKKLIAGIFKPEQTNIILEVTRKSSDIFYGFIIGKIIDSIIIGILCYIGCLIMGMPYAVLVSVIVGVTNVIPVFGPYIGAVPTVIVIFITEPMKGIYFLIFIIALQQFDGNWLGPKILGDSTGISSFWVVFAVVVGGGLLGVPGMIIGVPLVAIAYYILGRLAKYLLRRKKLPEDTSDYVRMKSIDTDTNTLIQMTDEEVEERNKVITLKAPKHKKNKK